MANRTGKRVALYLPQELWDHIQEARGRRSASEYIRTLIDSDMLGEVAELVARTPEPEPVPAQVKPKRTKPPLDSLWPILLGIDDDMAYWDMARAGYDDDGFVDWLFGNARFLEEWAKKSPHEAG